jgi:hypothetical protein
MQDPLRAKRLQAQEGKGQEIDVFLRRGKHVRKLEKKPGVTSDWEEAERKRVCK